MTYLQINYITWLDWPSYGYITQSKEGGDTRPEECVIRGDLCTVWISWHDEYDESSYYNVSNAAWDTRYKHTLLLHEINFKIHYRFTFLNQML